MAKKKGKALLVVAVLLLVIWALIFFGGFFYETSLKSKAMERYDKYGVVNIDGEFLTSEDEIDEYFKDDISTLLLGTMVLFIPGAACAAGYAALNRKK